MKKIYSPYKNKKVNALPALIIFEYENSKNGAASHSENKGYWLRTGEIAVKGYRNYEDFIFTLYRKTQEDNLTIGQSFVKTQGNANCFSVIHANSDGKWSYTETSIIKAEIKKIKSIEKEKEMLENSLVPLNSQIGPWAKSMNKTYKKAKTHKI